MTFQESVLINGKKDKQKKYMKFIDAGIACYAVCLLDRLEIVNDLINRGFIEKSELNDKMYENLTLLKAALKTLCLNGVLEDSGEFYLLTIFGKGLFENIGFINLLYGSYSKLLSHQESLLKGNIKDFSRLIDYDLMAYASDQLGNQEKGHRLMNVLEKLDFDGGICDLGCGSGKRVVELCDYFGVSGFGLDQCKKGISEAKRKFKKKKRVKFLESDVQNIKDKWDDVDLVMQCFMTHDIFPGKTLLKSLKSYLEVFPNMKYMVILDVASVEEYDKNSYSAPGLDYVHGLQNKEVYNRKELLEIFSKAGYKKIIDVQAESVPNSFIWVFTVPNNSF